jgi:hypothetical protein
MEELSCLSYSEDSRQAGKSSGPQNRASLSTLQRLNLEAPWGWGGKPHFLHTFCQGKQCGIYRRSNAVFWPKIGRVRSTCQAGRPCNLVGWPSFLLAPPLGIGYLEHCLFWTRRQNSFSKCTNTWPAGQGDVAGRPHLGSIQLMLCAMSFPRVIFSVTIPYFGHN